MADFIDKLFIALPVTLVILFVIFLILRELNCWYWKINEIITLLEDIKSSLHCLHKSDEATCDETVSNPKESDSNSGSLDSTPSSNESSSSSIFGERIKLD